jgi:NagD protein
METDIIAGVQTGMTTVLVLTGVSREADLERFAYRPDLVVRDAFALRELLERGV